MMTKCDVWRYVKTGGFWLTYAVLMGVNLFIIYCFSQMLYCDIFASVCWGDSSYLKEEYMLSIMDKLKIVLALFFTVTLIFFGNSRLYKKKKGCLWILGFWIYWFIISIIFEEYVLYSKWWNNIP